MKLYPFQAQGAEWLAKRKRAALFDEPGLGKTAQAIKASVTVGSSSTLCVVPSIVLWNWAHEFSLWAPGKRVQVIDTGVMDVDVLADVVVITHDLILNPKLRSSLLRWDWDVCILDEAHKLKSPTALRTKAFYGIHDALEHMLWGPGGLVHCVERAWILTGTPTPNDASEMWTHFAGLWPHRMRRRGKAMNYDQWIDTFCAIRPGYQGKPKIVGNTETERLQRMMDGVVLRRTVDEVLPDLPPVRYKDVYLRPKRLPEEVEALSRLLEEGLREDLEGLPVEQLAALGKGTEFSTFRRICAEAKVEPVLELLEEEIDHGLEKIVVFAHHTAVLDQLEYELGPTRCVKITGATAPKKRQLYVRRFQEQSRIKVALCNIVAGGTGATLTASREILFVERSFVPGENTQAVRRCRRIGVAGSVRVRNVVLAGTIDESVAAVLKRKVKGGRDLWRVDVIP